MPAFLLIFSLPDSQGASVRKTTLMTSSMAAKDGRSYGSSPSSTDRIDLGVVPLVDNLSGVLSIVPAIVSETMRSLSYCRIYGASMPMFYAQLFQLWFCSHLHYFYELQTSFYFERSTIRQSKGIDLPFDYSSEEWACI
jgi:hypothetical protein